MANFQVRDAYGSVITIQSSTFGTEERQVVFACVMGQLTTSNTSVTAFQGGNWITSLVSTIPSSVMVGASIFGTVPVTQVGTWAVSIAGAPLKTEDSGHTSGDVGIFMLGVRNDAAASFVGTDLDYSPLATDSAGRLLIKPFAPDEARVFGISSVVSTSITQLVGGSGAGLRTYLTDILVTNSSGTATQVTFRDGDASLIGRTMAPASSGSNIKLNTPMRTGGFNQQIDYVIGTAVSVLSIAAYGYKAP